MKKVLVILIFIIVSLSKNGNVFAQSNSIKVEYKQESIDSSDFSFRRKYKYLDIILKDEKNLIKIGIQPSLMYTRNSVEFIPHIAFERKISTEWSIILDDELSFRKERYMEYVRDGKWIRNTLNVGTRYYYGLNDAIQKKTSGNNFNRNYFEFNINGLPTVNIYNIKFVDPSNSSIFPMKGTTISLFSSAEFGWGIQRRLNNYTFLDMKIYAGFDIVDSYHDSSGYFGVDFIFGFGYNVKR